MLYLKIKKFILKSSFYNCNLQWIPQKLYCTLRRSVFDYMQEIQLRVVMFFKSALKRSYSFFQPLLWFHIQQLYSLQLYHFTAQTLASSPFTHV